MFKNVNFLPVSLRVDGRRVVVIGGGKIAAQKLRTLTNTTAELYVFAKKICDEIRQMRCTCEETPYEVSHIRGAYLVFACTDDTSVNKRIAEQARSLGILVNVADDPQRCEFISPAVWFKDPMSVAVSSDATDARRSVRWRNYIREWGENDTALR